MVYEEYLSAGMHIGIKQQTKGMKRFIYKTRKDGLSILDIEMIEKRIKIAGKFLSRFKRIIVVSRKNVGHKPVRMFAEATGAKVIAGRFLPGTITNPSFPGYLETDVLIVTDPLIDKQALTEAFKTRIPIVALADTFNETKLLDLVIPVNNKGRKSVAMVYYLLAREILKNKEEIKSDEEFKYKPEDFEE